MPAPLTILLITGEYPPTVGGVGDYTHRLGRALYARGHWVSVLTQHAAPGVQEPSEPAVVALGRSWVWRSWPRVAQIVAQVAPDIVHIQYQTGAYNLHPAINLLPWRLRRGGDLRPRIVVTAHDLRLPYLLPRADRLRTWVTRRLFCDADALIVTNAEDARRVAGLEPPDRTLYSPRGACPTPLELIPIGSNIEPQPPPGYDRAAWRADLGVAPAETLVAYFGLLSRTKGVRELLAALATLPPDVRLLIVGGAAPQPDDQRYAAEVRQLIAARGLSARVTITGPCPASDVSAHLLAADLVALPFADGASYRRGSLLAALAHGCAIVTTTPAAPLDPPLLDGRHALLTPPADPPAIATAIARLAADPLLRARLGEAAAALAAQFGWPAIAMRHETVYYTLSGTLEQKAFA